MRKREPQTCPRCGLVCDHWSLGRHDRRCFTTYDELLEVGRRLGVLRESGECLEWHLQGGADRRGDSHAKRPHIRGRRVTHYVLELTVGSAPEGRPEACHTCDNQLCISPGHLWWGSHKENMADMAKKGRGRNRPDYAERIDAVTADLALY